jgi:hypothetical protein
MSSGDDHANFAKEPARKKKVKERRSKSTRSKGWW